MTQGSDKPTILIVDDVPDNITVLSSILVDYNLKAANNGAKALEIASRFKPDIILLDIMMPEMDGYTVCMRLKRDFKTKDIPVIFVTAMDEVSDEARGFELGAVDYIIKPVSPPIVRARVKTHLHLYDQNRALEHLVHERTKALNKSRLEIIRRLGLAAEYKDNETGMHVIRMSYYCKVMATAMGMGNAEAELLLHASPMHDIGKIGIPDSILSKPGKLDAKERAIMETHTEIGARIIGEHDSALLDMARTVALTHHEKWDGTGYPRGLKGEDIPLVGRIVAIADVFDALVSNRPYKKAWPVEKAVALIKEESGKHFDPGVVNVFVANLDEILYLSKLNADPD
ncbi:two-component system response regulator [uncultured Desulfobacter sp.]|uniref:HD-GYP domain-containing protein n=1 Tax=uncultured Desulfobacter sp. TaxID=240139 RepID=UPI002AAA6EA8|nr:two-component system response regulator [uncultured Desulfobacter sp.]